MIDADLGLNNLDMVLGVENLVVYDLRDCLEGRCRPKQALIQSRVCKNAYLLPSVHSFVLGDLKERFKELIDGLSTCFDYILIDCPAGIDEGFHRAVATADEAIVVTTPHIPSLRDADKVITILKSYELKNVSLVVNMLKGELLSKNRCLAPQEIAKILKTPLLGVLPMAEDLYLNDLNESERAFRILANNLLTGKRRMLNLTSKYEGTFGSIRRFLKNL